jgi:alpha-tubulin suppressor-like RCC1 family protein
MMIRKQAVMASALLMTGCFGATAPSGTDGDAGKHTDATSPTNDRTDASTRMSDARPDAGGGKPDAELDASTGKPDADASKARPDADSGEDAAGQHTVTDVSVGFASACALASGGAVKCWGENYGGALGNGSIAGPETCSDFACSPSPLPVTGLTIATSVSVGLSAGCALLSGGTVDCWGDNASGQLGRGSATGPDDCGGFACGTTPAPVAGLAGVTAVSVGAQFACALVSGGTVECWGQNPDGELGIGNATGPEECG